MSFIDIVKTAQKLLWKTIKWNITQPKPKEFAPSAPTKERKIGVAKERKIGVTQWSSFEHMWLWNNSKKKVGWKEDFSDCGEPFKWKGTVSSLLKHISCFRSFVFGA